MSNYKNYNDYELLYLLSWHSEEALEILMKKYDSLILIKLAKFNVLKYHYSDYIQELRMTVFQAINKYDERHGKTLCRYLELIIDRRIIRLLSEDSAHINSLTYVEDSAGEDGKEFLEKMIYEERLDEINQVKLDDLKRELLQKVIIEGESVKTFAIEHNISVKDVYNHVYMLRLKLRSKINL